MKLRDLADLIGGKISGDSEIEITGVAGLNDAGRGDITFFAGKTKTEAVMSSGASAFIVKKEIKDLQASMLIVDNPQYIFARALEVFYVRPHKASGVSEKALIGRNVNMGGDITIHPFARVSDNVTLGPRVTVGSGAFIGEGSSIGGDSVIFPNATIRENVKIGSRVIVHSGAVIGSDGFGYVLEKGTHYKIPQVGGVIIEDNVEIGANVTIDRATVGNTIIGSGTKIDNLVQIAHNVKIGKNCIIVSQVGIGGSVVIGDGVVLAGQVGVRDHVNIGSGAIVASKSGVGSNIPEGQIYSGIPAIPHATWLRAQSIYSKLPDLLRRLQKIEKTIKKTSGEDKDI